MAALESALVVDEASSRGRASDRVYDVRRVAVLGAGTMGARIAAHIANAGLPVLLLDIVPANGERNSIAAGALEALKKAKPAAFADAHRNRIVGRHVAPGPAPYRVHLPLRPWHLDPSRNADLRPGESRMEPARGDVGRVVRIRA